MQNYVEDIKMGFNRANSKSLNFALVFVALKPS